MRGEQRTPAAGHAAGTEELLHTVVGGIFNTGLTLNAAIGLPLTSQRSASPKPSAAG